MPRALHWETLKTLSLSSQATGLTHHVWMLLLLRQCPQCSSDTVDSWQAQKHQDKIWKHTWGCVMNDFSAGLILAHRNPYPFPSMYWRTCSNSRASGLHFRLSTFFLSPISTDSVSYAAKSEQDKKKEKSDTGNDSKE